MIQSSSRLLQISLVAMSFLLLAAWVYWLETPPCNPQEAEAALATYADKGIHDTTHPPSMSNLLWVHVGPQWHALPLAEKRALDKVVRCAATTLDDEGQPTWQAAYYDNVTGKIVALTSRQYGFRLNNQAR